MIYGNDQGLPWFYILSGQCKSPNFLLVIQCAPHLYLLMAKSTNRNPVLLFIHTRGKAMCIYFIVSY